MCIVYAYTMPFYIGGLSTRMDFGICGGSWNQSPENTKGSANVLRGTVPWGFPTTSSKGPLLFDLRAPYSALWLHYVNCNLLFLLLCNACCILAGKPYEGRVVNFSCIFCILGPRTVLGSRSFIRSQCHSQHLSNEELVQHNQFLSLLPPTAHSLQTSCPIPLCNGFSLRVRPKSLTRSTQHWVVMPLLTSLSSLLTSHHQAPDAMLHCTQCSNILQLCQFWAHCMRGPCPGHHLALSFNSHLPAASPASPRGSLSWPPSGQASQPRLLLESTNRSCCFSLICVQFDDCLCSSQTGSSMKAGTVMIDLLLPVNTQDFCSQSNIQALSTVHDQNPENMY